MLGDEWVDIVICLVWLLCVIVVLSVGVVLVVVGVIM